MQQKPGVAKDVSDIDSFLCVHIYKNALHWKGRTQRLEGLRLECLTLSSTDRQV